MLEQIQEAKNYIESKNNSKPLVGIILGSGLGNLTNQIEIETAIPYSQIPHFPVSTVEGHQGQLILGKLNDVAIVAMQGRFHYYEGYSAQQCTFPIRVLKSFRY